MLNWVFELNEYIYQFAVMSNWVSLDQRDIMPKDVFLNSEVVVFFTECADLTDHGCKWPSLTGKRNSWKVNYFFNPFIFQVVLSKLEWIEKGIMDIDKYFLLFIQLIDHISLHHNFLLSHSPSLSHCLSLSFFLQPFVYMSLFFFLFKVFKIERKIL